MEIDSLALHYLREHPREAARTLEQFPPVQLAEYMCLLPPAVASDLFKFIIPSIAADCLRQMPLDKSVPIVTQLGIERATLLLRRMKSGLRVQFIRAMSPVFANMARLVLRYPEGTVGRVMNPHVFTVEQDMTTEQVMNAIRQNGQLSHNVIFITDENQRLVGIVDLRQLLAAESTQMMKSLMQQPVETIPARASVEQVTRRRDWNITENFPVVDHLGSFIGVLHRSEVYKLRDTDVPETDQALGGAALALAELFWDTCADLLTPNYQRSNKDTKDE